MPVFSDDANFMKMVNYVLVQEGPMSNNKYDPGGLTKFGIAKQSHPNVDIAALTVEQAMQLYYDEYYLLSWANKMPYAFGVAVFDCAVNQGVGRAVRLWQRAVGATEDGKPGPQSLTRLKAGMNSPEVLAFFMAYRVQAYVLIQAANPDNYRTNNKGWFKRLFLTIMEGASR